MSAASRELRLGSIVWHPVPDARGDAKENPRPIVILTPTEEIILDQPIVGVAVSTRVSEPPSPNEVPLPYSRLGHPATRLRRRCVAVCNWLVEVRPTELRPVEGYVPAKTLARILRRVREINEDPDIDVER